MTGGRDVVGFDPAAVDAWARVHLTDLTPPFAWRRLDGGHSNLTYHLTDAEGREAVIRRPPLGELLPKAHDMAREWTMLTALQPTPAPTPKAYGFCDDPSVAGARFYVMEFINARPLYRAADTLEIVPEARRRDLAFAFIDALADIHALDPKALGLGDPVRGRSYIARQLATWRGSWLASVKGARLDDPRAHSLFERLSDSLIEPDEGCLVHGDYGLHNCLVAEGGRFAAVVDWEIATLGDPLADLAYALNPWPDPSDPQPPRPEAATSPPGFPPRGALAARYQARTGRDLSRLPYYTAFNRWKSAAIIHGVYARYLEGQKSSEGVDLAALRAQILDLLAGAEAALAALKTP